MASMAKKKAKDVRASHAMVRMPVDVHRQLKAMAEANNRPLTRELRTLVVRALTENGFWPPTDQPPG